MDGLCIMREPGLNAVSHSIQDWLNYLKDVRHLSAATLKAYRRDMDTWVSFLTDFDETPKSANRTKARAFLALMSRQGMAVTSINRRLAALREYYNWNQQRGGKDSPFAGIKNIKQPRRIPGFLSTEEIEQFLNAAGKGFIGCGTKPSLRCSIRRAAVFRNYVPWM